MYKAEAGLQGNGCIVAGDQGILGILGNKEYLMGRHSMEPNNLMFLKISRNCSTRKGHRG